VAESTSELNQKVMAALVKKYGSKAAAEEAFRTLDGGELMRIKQEMGYAKGGEINPIRTSHEQAVIDYHRAHLNNGTYHVNDDGSLTTFYGAITPLKDGRWALVPTYLGKGKFAPNEEAALAYANKTGLKYPIYKSEDEAAAAETRLHSIMEKDTEQFTKSGEAPTKFKSGGAIENTTHNRKIL